MGKDKLSQEKEHKMEKREDMRTGYFVTQEGERKVCECGWAEWEDIAKQERNCHDSLYVARNPE